MLEIAVSAKIPDVDPFMLVLSWTLRAMSRRPLQCTHYGGNEVVALQGHLWSSTYRILVVTYHQTYEFRRGSNTNR